MNTEQKPELTLLYDGACPLCAQFALMVKLRERYTITLVDAREHPEWVAIARAKGVEPNDGSVLFVGEMIYQGEAAMRQLRSLVRPSMVSSMVGLLARFPKTLKLFQGLRALALRLKGVDRHLN